MMAMESRYPKGEIVLAHWKVEKHLGSGSNGKTAVFVLSHADFPEIRNALKVVNLITEEGSLEACTPFQKIEYLSARESCTKAAIQEVLLMSGLQGQPNIVSYLDHAVIDWEEDGCFGRDLLIRMELLTDLRKLMVQGKVFSEPEVIQIGTDICSALAVCHRKNIHHRDIKPENIFVNEGGVYKLGDFGISRILDSAPDSHASTGIGTPQYAAPEQFSRGYDKRADLYSLGLVLYELRNGNRLPFTDARSSMPEYVRRRLSGETFPELKSTSQELCSTISRACRFQPEERFTSAEEFYTALTGHAMTDDRAESGQSLPGKKKQHDSNEGQGGFLPRLTAVLVVSLILVVTLATAIGSRRKSEQAPATEPATLQTAQNDPVPVQSALMPAAGAALSPVEAGGFSCDLLDDGTLSITGFNGVMPAELVIPGEIHGKPVTVIGQGAFADQAFRSVVIPEGVTTIGPGAFVNCANLESVVFPASLRVIAFSVFVGCEKLGDVQLPNGLTAIGENAFNFTGITSIFIPASVKDLEDMFTCCQNLSRIDVAEDNPWYSSQDGVLFDKEKAKLIRYPSNHPSDTYTVPQGVEDLGRNAFEGTLLKSLELPEGLLSIGEGCFRMADNLRSLTIPASVLFIEDGAISSCVNLQSILVTRGSKNYVSSDGVLYSADMTVLLAFPSSRTGVFVIPDTVTCLGEYAFSGSRLSQVVVSDGISRIPYMCFDCCYSLKSVVLPEDLTEIQSCAFFYCCSLTGVQIPGSVSYIGRQAFDYCRELREVRLSNSDCFIEESAFPEDCQIIR